MRKTLWGVVGVALFIEMASFASAEFIDVNESHDNFDGIAYVESEGIVQGYEDGTYRPDDRINRAEFTKILVEAAYNDEVINQCINQHAAKYMISFGDAFLDVPDTEWFAKYVCTAYAKDVIEGYPDGSFKPAGDINFVEAAKIIVKTFDYPTEEYTGAEWYVPYVNVLEDKFAIPSSVSGYSAAMTRGEMAEMIYRLRADVMDKVSVFPSIEW